MVLKFLKSALSLAVVLMAVGASQAQAATVITFDDIPEGTIAGNQYTGVVFSGASVLTAGSQLNPPFPPVSLPNVVYDYLDGTIALDFTVSGITSVGAFVTGNRSITESIYNGATLLGTISTGGANFNGSGTGLSANIFLTLSAANITRAVFSNGGGFGNTFTLDNVTIDGAGSGGISVNQVPLPAALPLFASAIAAFGGFGAMRRKKVSVEA